MSNKFVIHHFIPQHTTSAHFYSIVATLHRLLYVTCDDFFILNKGFVQVRTAGSCVFLDGRVFPSRPEAEGPWNRMTPDAPYNWLWPRPGAARGPIRERRGVTRGSRGQTNGTKPGPCGDCLDVTKSRRSSKQRRPMSQQCLYSPIPFTWLYNVRVIQVRTATLCTSLSSKIIHKEVKYITTQSFRVYFFLSVFFIGDGCL